MEIYDFKNYSKIYVLGNMRGDFIRLKKTIASQSITHNRFYEILSKKTKKKSISNTNLNDSIIIVLGDCKFDELNEIGNVSILTELNALLADINSRLFLVRGSHDNPSYFKGKIKMSNLEAIDDYSIILTSMGNVLCVGGAVPINRAWRISKANYINKSQKGQDEVSYCENTAPIFDEKALGKLTENGIEVDFLATYSSPSFIERNCSDRDNMWIEADPKLLDDIASEHKVFDSIYSFCINNNATLKGWFYANNSNAATRTNEDGIYFGGLDDNFKFRSLSECFFDASENLAKIKTLNDYEIAWNDPFPDDPGEGPFLREIRERITNIRAN